MVSQGLSIHAYEATWIKHYGVKQDAAISIVATRALPLWVQLAPSLALLFAASFCAFGFLATFEPNSWWVAWPWRLGYAALGLGFLSGVTRLLLRRRINRHMRSANRV